MRKNEECNKRDVGNSRIIAVLAYLGILVVVPFLVEKKTEFVRYHVGQGITLFMLEVIYGIVYQFLTAAVLLISWRPYFIVRIVGCTAVIFPVFALIGIMNVVNGQEKELPVIGKIRLMK